MGFIAWTQTHEQRTVPENTLGPTAGPTTHGAEGKSCQQPKEVAPLEDAVSA